MEYDRTANIYMYSKLYHNKRPGVWGCPEAIALLYKILANFPSDFSLLKHTSLRTEFDDIAMTTATPDLYSKICSNGSISNHLSNGNGNGNAVIVKMKNGDNDNELSVVVTTTETSDNLILSK